MRADIDGDRPGSRRISLGRADGPVEPVEDVVKVLVVGKVSGNRVTRLLELRGALAVVARIASGKENRERVFAFVFGEALKG